MRGNVPAHQIQNAVYRMYKWNDVIEWREEHITITCYLDTTDHSAYYNKWLVKAVHWMRFCDEDNPHLDTRRFGSKLLKVFKDEDTAKAYAKELSQLPMNQQLGKWGRSHISTAGASDPLVFEEIRF